jgi:hypothetical protein
MKRLTILAMSVVLTGCATIRHHPYATAVALGIIGTSIALSASHEATLPPREVIARRK